MHLFPGPQRVAAIFRSLYEWDRARWEQKSNECYIVLVPERLERVEVVSSKKAALRSILALKFFSSTLAFTPLLCCSPIRAH